MSASEFEAALDVVLTERALRKARASLEAILAAYDGDERMSNLMWIQARVAHLAVCGVLEPSK